MKGRDNISDSYRKQVEELFDNQSDPSLLNPLDLDEMDEIWEGISAELDIEEVWAGISSELDIVMPVSSRSDIFLKTAAAVLIIISGLIPVRKAMLDSQTGQPEILVENKLTGQPGELIISNKPVDYGTTGKQAEKAVLPEIRGSVNIKGEGTEPAPIKSAITVRSPETIRTSADEVVAYPLTASIMADSSRNVSHKIISVEESDSQRPLFPDDLRKLTAFAEIDIDKMLTKELPSNTGNSIRIAGRGLTSGGLITSFKNTWLLNNETFVGLKSGSLNSSEVVFFPDLGLSLNYSLNKNWLLQTDGFFFSNRGQQYSDYIYGHYSRKKITLRYSEIALSVKHKFAVGTLLLQSASLNALAGSYVSVLYNANLEIDADIEDIRSQYRTFDYGVRIGVEFETHISDRFSLAPGLIMSLGIPNIYAGSLNIPGHLKQTHNGSAEFHLSVYYHFD